MKQEVGPVKIRPFYKFLSVFLLSSMIVFTTIYGAIGAHQRDEAMDKLEAKWRWSVFIYDMKAYERHSSFIKSVDPLCYQCGIDTRGYTTGYVTAHEFSVTKNVRDAAITANGNVEVYGDLIVHGKIKNLPK